MQSHDRTDTFIYADPPYHHDVRGATRYVHDYTNEDQERFIDCVLSIKTKVLISGYACKAYERLEQNNFRRVDFTTNTIVESLWKNY